MNLVEAVGVSRHYRIGRGTLRALDGVDLGIAAGETLGLVGESGSGKSTLGRTLLGLQEPTHGTVRFDGVNIAQARGDRLRALRRRRGLVFQDPSGALNPRMTIGATLYEHLLAQGFPRPGIAARAAEVLAQAGLGAEYAGRYPHELSGGQRQRAVIARAISTDPDFIVADEPVSALDVSTRAQIINLLRGLQRARGMSMLFISHDLSVVAHTTQRVAVLYLGRVVEVASRARLFASPLHPYTQALMSAVPLADPVRERARRRVVLAGDTPDPTAPPSGCRFHPRCWRATSICRNDDPLLVDHAPSHAAACHHAGSLEGAGAWRVQTASAGSHPETSP